MFWKILTFELKYKFRKLNIYLFWGILFGLSFLMVNAMGGLVDGVSVAIGAGGNVYANSPYTIHLIISSLSYIGIIIIPGVLSTSIYRDYETNAHALFYSYPITKWGYLGGRFLGGFIAVMFVYSAIGIGYYLATFMPWLNENFFGANQLSAYLYPYLTTVIPNTLFAGIILYAAVIFTRNLLSNYMIGIALLVLFGVAETLLADLDNSFIASILDPLGNSALMESTKYWTVAMKNSMLIPLDKAFLLNRLIWTGLGVLLFAYVYHKFKFSQNVFTLTFRKNSRLLLGGNFLGVKVKKISLPKVHQSFNMKSKLKAFWRLTQFEFLRSVKNNYFLGILITGLLFLVINGAQIGKMFGTNTYPVTYQVAGMLGATFTLFMIIFITFFSGEMIWRDRNHKVSEITNSMPLPNWTYYTSKLTALSLIMVLLMAFVMIVGIVTQAVMGYYNFELEVYFKYLFFIQLVDYLLFSVLALFVHIVVNNKYTGHFILILFWILQSFMGQFGLEHNLYQFASDPGIMYSDMNEFGHMTWPFLIFKLYWISFAVILAILSNSLYIRKNEENFIYRWHGFKTNFKGTTKWSMIIFTGMFIGIGSFIYYNTNIVNEFTTSKESIHQSVEYEKKYKKYEHIAQPRIIAVNMNLDIYPEKRDYFFEGYYLLKNKTKTPIDSILVQFEGSLDINKFQFDQKFRKVYEDEEMDLCMYRLEDPLMPGDTMKLDMQLAYTSKGFRNSGSNLRILENGTFLTNGSLPAFGYQQAFEVRDKRKREKYDLPERDVFPSVHDQEALKNTYISNNADWVDFETIVSTVADQIALAPGYLQREWEEDGRRFFHYKMDAKILNFFSWLSADYKVKRDTINGIDLAVYYDEKHPYNVDYMMESMKASLDYYGKNFSPYQFRQARIFEFPRFSSFAQAFPNSIPFSESVGFIADIKNNDINYPYYVTAHEMAHQWWAHQVIGGNVEGCTVMSEVLAQYSALMVMEKFKDKEEVKRFLRHEQDQYLTGRSMEQHYESPIIFVRPSQGYIHYGKGAVVMYALKEYIGEDRVNNALKRYIDDYSFQEPPYTTSLEFIEYLKEATPDSMQTIIHDWFERIIIYDNKIAEAKSEALDSNKYQINLELECRKFQSDSLGNETEIAPNDWIQIALYTKDQHDEDSLTYLNLHRIDDSNIKLQIQSDEKPEKVTIDPYYLLIDRHKDDNTKYLSIE